MRLWIVLIYTIVMTLGVNDLFAAQANRLAVLRFQVKEANETYGDIARDLVEIDMQKSGIFDVIEREQVGLILKERNFQESENSGSGYAVKVGKVISADVVVIGSIIKLNGYTVTAKVVEVSSGMVVVSDLEQAADDKALEMAIMKLSDRVRKGCAEWQALNRTVYSVSEMPVFLGISYRLSIMSMESIRITNGYEEIYHADDARGNRMGCVLEFGTGINRYLTLRGATVINFYERFNYIHNNWETYDTHFTMGLEFMPQFNYRIRMIEPFVAAGCGCQYQSVDKNQIGAAYFRNDTASVSYGYDLEPRMFFFTINGETGFNLYLLKNMALTLTFGINWAPNQSWFSKKSLIKKISGDPSGDPVLLSKLDLTSKDFPLHDPMMGPTYYFQIGVMYRL